MFSNSWRDGLKKNTSWLLENEPNINNRGAIQLTTSSAANEADMGMVEEVQHQRVPPTIAMHPFYTRFFSSC